MRIFTFLFLFISAVTVAQNVSYSGVVLDSETHQPIEHVSITANNSNAASLTNSEGKFKIFVPNDTKKLFFKHLDFNLLEYNLNDKNKQLVIYLENSGFNLEEIIIYNRPIKEVIKEVIDNSKSKFAKNLKLNTYYREMMNVDGKIYSYADGILDYYYKNKSVSNVIVNESRAVEFTNDFTNYEQAPIKFYLLDLQTIITSAFKFERIWNIISNPNYELYITSKKASNGKEIKTLYFEPDETNTRNFYKGTLVFDEEKKLVLEINIEISPNHIKNLKEENRVLYKMFFTKISFKQIFNDADNKYFLAYDTRRLQADVKITTHIFSIGGVHELITVNSEITNEKPNPKEIYFEKTLNVLGQNYKTRFWENQNVILLNQKEEEMLKILNNKR